MHIHMFWQSVMFSVSRFGACNNTIFVCVGFNNCNVINIANLQGSSKLLLKKDLECVPIIKSIKFDTFSTTKYNVKHFFLIDSFDVVDYKIGYISWSKHCVLEFTKWNLNWLTKCSIAWSSTTFTTRLQSSL